MRRLPSREHLEARAGGNLSPERWYKPEVRPVEIDGTPCLWKDFGRSPFLWRHTAGRFVIAREAAAYRALEGLRGVPGFRGRPDAFGLLVERIDGRDVSEYREGRLPPGFLDRLDRLVGAMHDRGVVHLDLRQRKNVLVGPGGEPWLIDFASGVPLHPGSLLIRWLRVADLSGVAKLRAKHAPDSLTERHRRLLSLDLLRPLRMVRKLRRERRRRRRREARRRRRAACEES